jgi:hypothetical protein
MYADDLITFVWLTEVDLLTCAVVVEDSGVASGLRNNLAKLSLHPICCLSEQVELAMLILGFQVASFPFKNMVLPLDFMKVTQL